MYVYLLKNVQIIKKLDVKKMLKIIKCDDFLTLANTSSTLVIATY